jgi:hypothetical protein
MGWRRELFGSPQGHKFTTTIDSLLCAQDTFQPKTHVAIKIMHADYGSIGEQEAGLLSRLQKMDPLE